MGFIVGFNRDRDHYQVPLAFAEVQDLDCLVTDYYHPRAPLKLARLRHRAHELISPELVREVPGALLLQMAHELHKKVRPSARFPSGAVDELISRRIVYEARMRPESSLFLYSGYAAAAFLMNEEKARNLFQFHPSPSIIREALLEDDLGDSDQWWPEPEVLGGRADTRYETEIRIANRVVCASSFTRRGLIADGVDASSIRVVPYGCPEVSWEEPPELADGCRFLFVGQGVQRKGLHTLLVAWRHANLSNAKLRIVASKLDPAIARLARNLDGVTLSGSVSAGELEQIMNDSDTLVLPSLVEGFGLVLGEALARGCRLIASTNTGIVDMALPPSVGQVVAAGSIEALIAALRASVESFDPEGKYAKEARLEATRLSWRTFRAGIRASAF